MDFHDIARREFLPASRFDDSVEPDLAPLDQDLGFAPCFDESLQLQELIQADRSRIVFVVGSGIGHCRVGEEGLRACPFRGMISSSGSRRNLAIFSLYSHVLPMSALLSMLIISALLLGVIAVVSKVTLGD